MIEIIKKYFPNLSDKQMEQFEMLDALYRGWQRDSRLRHRWRLPWHSVGNTVSGGEV